MANYWQLEKVPAESSSATFPKKVRLCVRHWEGIVTAIDVSKDGQHLVTAGQGDDFHVKLWSLPEGKLLRTFDDFSGYVHSPTFGPDGTWFVAWSNDGKSHVLDTTQGKQLLVIDGNVLSAAVE